jgi:hypothetical protein
MVHYDCNATCMREEEMDSATSDGRENVRLFREKMF